MITNLNSCFGNERSDFPETKTVCNILLKRYLSETPLSEVEILLEEAFKL